MVGMVGGRATSVAPTTTATALTSLTTGVAPAAHGVVGYRVRVPGDEVMNVLAWRTPAGDARQRVDPASFVRAAAFPGGPVVPVVTRSEFAATGFTVAHLGGSRLIGWRQASTLVVEVDHLLKAGVPYVYAYYDGIDRVAHEYGLGEHWEAEVRASDRLVSDLIEILPPDAALVVTADHGQVDVGEGARAVPAGVGAATAFMSGEGRFRWLHARPGAGADLLAAATESFGDEAWVFSRDELVGDGWLGGEPDGDVCLRLGDVAIVPFAPIAIIDPADPGERRLMSRHGSLTEAEMYVPLLAQGG